MELCKDGYYISARMIYAEMPSDQFKQLNLKAGDKVSLFIKHAHWFNLAKPRIPETTTGYAFRAAEMNLNQLEILRRLQETGYNLTKVVEKINTVRSVVSRQLIMLEDEIGTPLFKWHGKRISGSTPLGVRIMAEVESLNQAKRNIRAISDD